MSTENIHEVGELLDKRFEVIKVMQGGMGQIFVCIDHFNDGSDLVVLKTFKANPKSKGYQACRDRFLREAEAWYRIGRAGGTLDAFYVGLSGTTIIKGRPYLLMSYCPGGSLREQIANGPLLPDAAVSIATQVLLGLQIIGDGYGIVHRDIKPENVLFFKHDHAAVSDLGIANFIDAVESTLKFTQKSGALTQYGSFIGTVPYAAPEQLVGTSPLDQGVDIWAFGILLYEMITGTLPFTGESVEDLAGSIMTNPVPGLEKITKHCGKPVARVIKKCLRKTRSARYGNFHDLIRDWDKVIRFSSSPKVGIFGQDTRFFIANERIEFQFLRFFPQRQSGFEGRVNLSAINRCLEAGDLRRIGKPEMALDSCRIALETVVNGRTNLDRLLAHELGDNTELLEWQEESSNEVTARYALPTEDIAEGALYTAMCCYVDIIEDMKSNPSKLREKNNLLTDLLALCDRVKNGTYHSNRLMLMYAQALLLDDKYENSLRILTELQKRSPEDDHVANVYWITATKFLSVEALTETALVLLQTHAKRETAESKILCARIFNYFRKFPRVEEMAREALVLDPNNLYVMYMLAGALLNQSKMKEALAIFGKMRQLDPSDNLTKTASQWFESISYTA